MARRATPPINFNNNINFNKLLNTINNDGTIRATPLYPTLYSIVVNSGDTLNLSEYFITPKNHGVARGGFKVEVLKIVGRAGRFQKVKEATKEYGVINNSKNKSIDALEFKIRVSKGGEEKGGIGYDKNVD